MPSWRLARCSSAASVALSHLPCLCSLRADSYFALHHGLLTPPPPAAKYACADFLIGVSILASSDPLPEEPAHLTPPRQPPSTLLVFFDAHGAFPSASGLGLRDCLFSVRAVD